MADSWTVTAIDRDIISVNLVVGSTTYSTKIATADILPVVDLTDAANRIRPIVTALRASILASTTIPQKFVGAVGYSEPFS